MKLKQAIRQFCFYIKSNGHSHRTFQTYRGILEELLDHYPDAEVEAITFPMLQGYVAGLKKKDGSPLAPASMNQVKACIRSFFNWLCDADMLPKNPGRMIRLERIPQREAKYLNVDEIARFREGIKAHPRDQLLFELALNTGLRLSELHGLNLGDVRGKDSFSIVGKGKKSRMVFLSPSLQTLISQSINGDTPDSPLFKNLYGGRLGRAHIQRLMKVYLRKAGLPLHFSPHSLRHSFLTEVYRKTHDLRLTQELAGHSSPNMTARYAHVSDVQKKEAVQDLF